MAELLPIANQPRAERRDAAHNREVLLRAALELVESEGVASVTMDAVAARAGVGKGTLFRRFESRAGLMIALLDLSEREWQAQVMSGPPPLGPGAPPLERLLAFGESRLGINLRHAELIDAAYRGPSATGAFTFPTIHVRYLLRELGVAGDIAYLATALVAPLELVVMRAQIDLEEATVERMAEGWRDLALRVVG